MNPVLGQNSISYTLVAAGDSTTIKNAAHASNIINVVVARVRNIFVDVMCFSLLKFRDTV